MQTCNCLLLHQLKDRINRLLLENLNEINTLLIWIISVPIEPEPFTDHSRNTVGSPVDEYSKLCLIIPARDGSGVKTLPIGVISLTQTDLQQHH